MKNYENKGSLYEITLENDKVVKVASAWVKKTMETLGTDLEDVLLMWLEDNDYLVNEEQDELDKKAKANKSAKIVNAKTTEKKVVKKTPKERTQKENPTKEKIISLIAESLQKLDTTDVNIENKAKIITFTLENKQFKIDLTEKRKPKAENV